MTRLGCEAWVPGHLHPLLVPFHALTESFLTGKVLIWVAFFFFFFFMRFTWTFFCSFRLLQPRWLAWIFNILPSYLSLSLRGRPTAAPKLCFSPGTCRLSSCAHPATTPFSQQPHCRARGVPGRHRGALGSHPGLTLRTWVTVSLLGASLWLSVTCVKWRWHEQRRQVMFTEVCCGGTFSRLCAGLPCGWWWAPQRTRGHQTAAYI